MIPESGRSPGGGNGDPLQCFHLKKPHGQRSPVGYNPRCHKESDTTERLSTQAKMPLSLVSSEARQVLKGRLHRAGSCSETASPFSSSAPVPSYVTLSHSLPKHQPRTLARRTHEDAMEKSGHLAPFQDCIIYF